MDTVTAGNIAIAEFMYGGDKSFNKERLRQMYFKYHNSWVWLMDVVDKVEALGYSVFIQNDACWIRAARPNMKLPILSTLGESKILATWETIILFINWYQTNKPNQ